jgi:dihydrofolate reductase
MEAIYAVDLKNGLSKLGKIPWYSKKDLNFFMDITKNNVIIMGKNTYFSLPDGNRPLKNRLNIVLTSKPEEFINYKEESGNNRVIFTANNKIYDTIIQTKNVILELHPYLKNDFKIFFIGGKQIYEKYIPLCERVWVTQIKKDYSCDLFLEYDYSKEFKEEFVEEDDELKIVKYEKSILT